MKHLINKKGDNYMTNFEWITQNLETMVEFLDTINIGRDISDVQMEWQNYLGESSLRWLMEEY